MKTEDIKNMTLAWKKVQEAANPPAEKVAEVAEGAAAGPAKVMKPIKGKIKLPMKDVSVAGIAKAAEKLANKSEGKLPPALAAAIAKKKGEKVDDEDDGEEMDKVDPKANKKKFADRKDKDIDNDGDVDSSDKFLHKRRKAIGKKKAAAANGKDTEVEVQTQESVSEAHKDGMVCKDCGCEQGHIKEDCDCPNDGADMEGKHWIAKAESKTESISSPADLMKALDEVSVPRATTKPGNGSPPGEGLSPNAKAQLGTPTVPPEADAPAVNKKSFDAMRSSLKTGKMRDNDNAKGDKAIIKSTKSEGVEVSELSKGTMGSYVKRATSDMAVTNMAKGVAMAAGKGKESSKLRKDSNKRRDGISKAVDKLSAN